MSIGGPHEVLPSHGVAPVDAADQQRVGGRSVDAEGRLTFHQDCVKVKADPLLEPHGLGS